MPICSVVSFSATVEILIRLYRRGGGERRPDTAQTIGPNCGVTHSPGKIEYNCHYFLMTFRTQIHKKKLGKSGFRTLQGTMSHRPLTNTSSLNHCSLMGSPWPPTVGAQSIAPAQSIAHGQIDNSISQKTKFLKKNFLQKKKNGKFSSRFLNKILQF